MEEACIFRRNNVKRFLIVEIEMSVKPTIIPENVVDLDNKFQTIMSKMNIENALKEDDINLDISENIKSKSKRKM